MIKYLILLPSLFLDVLANHLVNSYFATAGSSMTPNITFISLMLLNYDQKFSKGFIASLTLGLLFDFVNVDSLLSYTFIFLLCFLVMRAWQRIINESFFELLSLCLSLVFLKELFLYLLSLKTYSTVFSVMSWAEKHMFLTIIFAFFTSIILIFAKERLSILIASLKYRVKKEERLSFFDL